MDLNLLSSLPKGTVALLSEITEKLSGNISLEFADILAKFCNNQLADLAKASPLIGQFAPKFTAEILEILEKRLDRIGCDGTESSDTICLGTLTEIRMIFKLMNATASAQQQLSISSTLKLDKRHKIESFLQSIVHSPLAIPTREEKENKDIYSVFANLTSILECTEILLKYGGSSNRENSSKDEWARDVLTQVLDVSLNFGCDKIAFRSSALIGKNFGSDRGLMDEIVDLIHSVHFSKVIESCTNDIQRKYAAVISVYSLVVLNDAQLTATAAVKMHSVVRDALSLSAPGGGIVKKAAIGILRHLTREERVWLDFVHVLEALEESQVHLVAPVLPTLNGLLEYCQDECDELLESSKSFAPKFSIEWVLVAFRVGFFHSNGWVRVWLIQRALNLDLKTIFYTDDEFLFGCLFPRLNDSDIFRRFADENCLKKFLRDLECFLGEIFLDSDSDQYAGIYESYLCAINAIPGWQPVPIFYLSYMLTKLPKQQSLSLLRDQGVMWSLLAKTNVVQIGTLKRAIFRHWISVLSRWYQWTPPSYLETLTQFFRLLPQSSHRTFFYAVSESAEFSMEIPEEWKRKTLNEKPKDAETDLKTQKLEKVEQILKALKIERDRLDLTVDWDDLNAVFGNCKNLLLRISPEEFLKNEMDEPIESVVNDLLRTVETMKKTESHMPAIKSFLGVILCGNGALLATKKLRNRILQIVNGFISEGELYPPIALAVPKEIFAMISERKEKETTENGNFKTPHFVHERAFVDLITRLCTFGPILRKDARTVNDALKFLDQQEPEFQNNEENAPTENLKEEYLTSELTRIFGAASLLRLTENSDANLTGSLVDSFIELSLMADEDKTISVGHSYGHRLKTRCMQMVLLMEGRINSEACCTKLFAHCVSTMLSNSQQNSVKLLTEWVLARLCLKMESLRGKLTSLQSEIAEKRVGAISSWLAVNYHLITSKISPDKEDFEFLFKLNLPWCQAQNFVVRCTALAILKGTWEKYCSFGFSTTEGFAPLIKACVENRFENRNQLSLIDKLASDFWFSKFHIHNNYSIEDIFYSVPVHCNMPEEEILRCIDLPVIVRSFFDGTFLVETPKEHKIAECESTIWKGQNSDKPSEYEQITQFVNSGRSSIGDAQQKKPVVAPVLSPDLELCTSSEAKENQGSLILVLSLLDKATNLGGLCRTCEIFGVSEVIIGNKKTMEDQNFKNLSVSAENWINVTEIKRFHLPQFLAEKSTDGYILVGLEQTTTSIGLGLQKFPDKTCILLGNEKSGIPVELIQLMDYCIEIPQAGIIRSLNVHVAGALLIFEYYKQQRKQDGEMLKNN